MTNRSFCLCIAALAASFTFAPMSFANEQTKSNAPQPDSTFDVSENWLTYFISSGGSIDQVTGAVPPLGWQDDANFVNLAPRPRLPVRFDWREQVAGGLQPVRNQKTCGSCWAFATTAVLESLLMIQNQEISPDLAEQTLVSSCHPMGTCSGGWFTAFEYMIRKGLPQESADPYTASNTYCRSGLNPVASVADYFYVKGDYGRSPSVDQIKTAIHDYGPVAVTVNASFFNYAGGVYNACNNGPINHMVVLEGWDDETETWLMRNSWGTGWGEEGYMRIKWNGANGQKCNNVGQNVAVAVLTAEG